jgi:hypothetical protein
MLNNVDMYANFQKFKSSNLWTPAGVATRGWYDASDLATITSVATAVSQWNDKSGNLRNLAQGTGTLQPKTGTRLLNGLNVLDFDGGDYINRNAFPLPADGNVAFFMVAVVDAIDNTSDTLFAADAANDFEFRSNNATQFNGQLATANLGGGNLGLTGGPFPGPSIYNCNFDRTGLVRFNAFVDGTQRGANTTYSASLSTSQILQVFRNRSGTAQMPDGACAEFIVIDDVSSITREKVEGYLAWKWGLVYRLPGGHPYKTYPPYAI